MSDQACTPENSLETKAESKLEFDSKHEENHYYYNMVNPQNGLRYDIPMLSTLDTEYYFKYVHFMKIKERSEETFNKMLNWDWFLK